MYYISPVEVVPYPPDVHKEVLLTTSPYTQLKSGIVQLDFSMMTYAPVEQDYQSGILPIAVRAQGRTSSYLGIRMTEEDRALLDTHDRELSTDSFSFDQVVIGDTDFIMPANDPRGRYYDIGFNPSEGQMYDANIGLLGQLLESMIYGDDLLALRHRTMSIKILNKNGYQNKKALYTLLILGLPVFLMALLFVSFRWYRKKKYAS